MAKVSYTQFDFSGGELPPLRMGRTNDAVFGRSLALAQDFIPDADGPISNRPGTQRIAQECTYLGNTRVFGIESSLGTGYILEVTESRVRVVRPLDFGTVLKKITVSGGAFEEIDFSMNGVYDFIPELSTPTSEIYRRYETTIRVIGGEPRYNIWEIQRVLGYVPEYPNEFAYTGMRLAVNMRSRLSTFTYFQAYPNGSFGFSSDVLEPPVPGLWDDGVPPTSFIYAEADIVAVSTTYLEDEIPDIRVFVSGAVMYLSHPNHPPAILYQDSSGSWVYDVISFTRDAMDPASDLNDQIDISIEEYDYQVSLYRDGYNFSVFTAGDMLSYMSGNHYVLAEFVRTDDSNDRAIVKPVKSVVTDIDPKARIEYQSNPSFIYLGASLGVPVISTNSAVFNVDLVGSYLRFTDIGSTGQGSIVYWAKLSYYLGVDLAASGFFTDGGTNAAEVDIFRIDGTVGLLQEGTTVRNIGLVDRISTKDYRGVALNTTDILASSDLFALSNDGSSTTGSDMGRAVQLVIDDTVLHGTIIDSTDGSPTRARIEIDGALPYGAEETPMNFGKVESWRLGSFYSGNYPHAVTVYAQRLSFGGTASHPSTVWHSKVDRFFDFSPVEDDNTVQADTAFSLSLLSRKLSMIRWLHSGDQLLAGLESSIWKLSGQDGLYSYSTAFAREQATIGSIIQPVQFGSTVIFVHASGRILHQLRFDDSIDAFEVDDGTVIPNHLFTGAGQKIVDLDVQLRPEALLWIVREDGLLVSLTPAWNGRDRSYALARHVIGSEATTALDTLEDELADALVDEDAELLQDATITISPVNQARVMSVASLFSSSSSREDCFVFTLRGPCRLLERLSFDYVPQSSTDKEGMLYLDSSLSITVDTPKNEWTEFTSYEDEVVSIVADGILVQEVYMVPASILTLPNGIVATTVVIGYAYVPRLRSLPLSLTLHAGNVGTQSRISRFTGVLARVLHSLGISHGENLSDLIIENFENNDDVRNGTDLYTGDLALSFHNMRSRSSQFYIEQRSPYPLTILSLTYEGEVQ